MNANSEYNSSFDDYFEILIRYSFEILLQTRSIYCDGFNRQKNTAAFAAKCKVQYQRNRRESGAVSLSHI